MSDLRGFEGKIPASYCNVYAVRGIASYSVKSRLVALLAKIKERGLGDNELAELRRLLRSSHLPHRTGVCPIEGHYIITVKEGEGIYKNFLDPYIDCEILSSCIADAVFETIEYILKSVYDLDTTYDLKKHKRKWEIFHSGKKLGDLSYDTEYGFTKRRLRASMTKRMIAICWRREALVTQARIHFDPKEKRWTIRDEVLPSLVRKKIDFEAILASRPAELFRVLMKTL